MSESLSEFAPDIDLAAPDAPELIEAVEDESGVGGAKQVPAERFNGLMSKFNKTNEELATERQYRLDLEARLQALEFTEYDMQVKEPQMADVSNLQNQVELLTQMLAQQQVANVRKDVLTEFPDIAPFVDLIEAPDPESFRSLAQTLNERVQVMKTASGGIGDIQESLPDPVAPVLEEQVVPQIDAPVFGGGSGAMAPAPGTEDRVAEAIKNRDFGAFMRAKTEQASSELEL